MADQRPADRPMMVKSRSQTGSFSPEYSTWYATPSDLVSRTDMVVPPYRSLFLLEHLWCGIVKLVTNKTAGPEGAGCFVTLKHQLVLDVWHEGHEASALSCGSKVALPLGGKASSTTIHHACMWVHIGSKTSDVFVVDMVEWFVLCSFFFHIFKIQ